MTVAPYSFRVAFPAFSDSSVYPDAQIAFWLNFAGQIIDPDVWDTMADLGVQLLVAHNLTLFAKDQKAAAAGIAGSVSGLMTSKAVGGVSASYDINAVTMERGGAYNLTSYGVRFLQLARMFGTGGMQL